MKASREGVHFPPLQWPLFIPEPESGATWSGQEATFPDTMQERSHQPGEAWKGWEGGLVPEAWRVQGDWPGYPSLKFACFQAPPAPLSITTKERDGMRGWEGREGEGGGS